MASVGLLVSALRESQTRIIQSHEIAKQAEIPKVHWSEYLARLLIEPGERAKTTLRVGRLGDLSVVYKTIVANSATDAHDASY
jgi:hypothetical protein